MRTDHGSPVIPVGSPQKGFFLDEEERQRHQFFRGKAVACLHDAQHVLGERGRRVAHLDVDQLFRVLDLREKVGLGRLDLEPRRFEPSAVVVFEVGDIREET